MREGGPEYGHLQTKRRECGSKYEHLPKKMREGAPEYEHLLKKIMKISQIFKISISVKPKIISN